MARYTIISIDNGCFGDGGDPMNRGEFDDPHAALDRAMELVDEALGRCFPSVKNAKELMDLYTIYGDEVPMIYGEPRINFNAYDYARVKAVSMFAEIFGVSSPEATLPPDPEWIKKAKHEVDTFIANIESARLKSRQGPSPNRRVPESSDGRRLGLASDQRPLLTMASRQQMIGSEIANSAKPASRISAEWPLFVERLEAVLRHMREDQFLVISAKDSNRYVQFAAQGAFGLHAEAVSNTYLPPAEQFDDKATAALLALGWHHPSGSPQESTPAADPHGSPNFFVDSSQPVPFAAIAELAARTLAGVMGVPHTGFLQYESFERNGRSLNWPRLDLRRAVRAPSPSDVRQQVLQELRQRTGIVDLDYVGDGHLYLPYGSALVRIRLNGSPRRAQIDSMLLKRIKTSRALMKRLNDLNANLGPLHLFCDSQGVHATADVPVEPFEPIHLAEALANCCRVADGIDKLLQAEFGGTTTFLEPMPSALKH